MNKKKSVALIADVKNWSFDIDAHLMKKAIENEFKVDIFYSKEYPLNGDFYKIINAVKDYDIIYFFWRKDLLPITEEKIRKEIEKMGINVKDFVNKVATGIYDHLYIEESNYIDLLNNYCKKYIVSSNILYTIYCKNDKIKNPDCILTDTFDEEIFYPQNLKRFNKKNDEELVLGWVGNSTWYSKKGIDFKGYNTIYKPVCDKIISEGYKIKCFDADRRIKLIPQNEMRLYYSRIDIYICVSKEEGTPRPLMEAMGCGIPIITTDVGVARQYLGNIQKKYIIGCRENEKKDEEIKIRLKDRILKLYNNRNLLTVLSKENYENSKKINFLAYKEKYCDFFKRF